MESLKGKFILWSHNGLSLAGRILVANQVLLASTWYLAACWNPDPRMSSQVRGLVRNFIWGGKETPTRAKVRWETLILPLTQGGLGVIDPKSQSEALLAKLLVRGLAPGGEPWKELVWYNAGLTKLPHHGKDPSTPDFNWLLAAPKLKRLKRSMWRSIVEAWLNVRPGLTKKEPTTKDEILRQPIFGNPSILSASGTPLGVSGRSEGSAFAHAGCTRIRDLWNPESQSWKGLSELGMSRHAANIRHWEIIMASIPWRLDGLEEPGGQSRLHGHKEPGGQRRLDDLEELGSQRRLEGLEERGSQRSLDGLEERGSQRSLDGREGLGGQRRLDGLEELGSRRRLDGLEEWGSQRSLDGREGLGGRGGRIQVGDWIASPTPITGNPPDWVYLVLAKDKDTTEVLEFKRSSPTGRIQLTSNQAHTMSTVNKRQVRVLV